MRYTFTRGVDDATHDSLPARRKIERAERDRARQYIRGSAEHARLNGGAVAVMSALEQEWKFNGSRWRLHTRAVCTVL